jgi:S1-C subfamily serine protease
MDDEVFYGSGSESAHQDWAARAPGYAGYGIPAREPSGKARRRRRTKLVAASTAVALAAGGIGAGLGVALSGGGAVATGSPHGQAVSVPSATETSGKSMTTAAIAAEIDPAVVDIDTVVASPSSEGQEDAAGTGMILTSAGEVLTNNHVVEDATSIRVTVQGRSGSFAAKVIAVDPTEDVALLQIEGVKNPLPTIKLGNSSTAAVGTSVVAIGNAEGLGQQPTVVTGQITATGRTITASDEGSGTNAETLHNLLQTDAEIVPGDSGGPLVNSSGQVIGMDTAASSSEQGATMGFAIPINTAINLVDDMVKGKTTNGIILGETPYLGIFESSSSTSGSRSGYGGNGYGGNGYGFGGGFGGGFGYSGASGSSGSSATSVAGVYVEDVSLNGPAYNAGIRAGDTITSLDGKATTSLTQLKSVLDSLKPGAKATVAVVGPDGSSQTLTVTIGAIPQ